MKVKYELIESINGFNLYNTKFTEFDIVDFLVCEDFKVYNEKEKKSLDIKKGDVIQLQTFETEKRLNSSKMINIKRGLYYINKINDTKMTHNYLVSKEQLNTFAILLEVKQRDFFDNNHNLEGIKIKKNMIPFYVYKTPILNGEIKKSYLLNIDYFIKKMFNNCGDIILNSYIRSILNNIKDFNELFLVNKNEALLLGFQSYLKNMYEKMYEMEPKSKKVKTAKDYFELETTNLNNEEINFLTNLKIKEDLYGI